MKEYIELGAAPEDDFIEGGDESFQRNQALRWKQHLGAKFPAPEGASYRVRRFDHDLGAYFEVVLTYDDDQPQHVDFVNRLVDSLPTSWETN
jgi:hypothetical protein